MVIVTIGFWIAFILFRLAQLQILEHKDFVQLALKQQQKTQILLAPRGIIYDTHMDELGTSILVSTVTADPRNMQNKGAVAQSLAATLGMDVAELTERLNDPKHQNYQVIKRRIDPNVEARLEELQLEGIHLTEESMRVYPNRSLASHILGFVNMNGDGGAGVELEYDKELRGEPGLTIFDVDGQGKSFRGKVKKPPLQGNSLVLSIDKSIQYIAEHELAAGVEATKAIRGVAIVLESETGRVLALASYPDFNCNTYNEYDVSYFRNHAVSDLFEPGSTFKVVVATAALDAGLTRPDEVIDCQMGKLVLAKHVFHDHKPLGLLTFNQVLEHSSNIGAAKLGLRLGEQRLYEALRRFGFGSKTQVDLPGEIIGLVRDVRSWSALSVAAISFGQEVGVTSMQMAVAINAIANGGERVRPSVVDRIIGPKGDLVTVRTPEKTRIMSPSTAAAVRNAFEGVVLRGTGRRAALQGYRAAGKTGTAQKIVDGHYSKSKYVASFIGFAPLPQPRVTVLVQIDEPRGAIYGGDVAAPIFQKITQQTLVQLHVAPDQTLPLPKVSPSLASATTSDFLPDATPIMPVGFAGASEPNTAEGGAIIVRTGDASIDMPDFRGMAKRKVMDRCLELGIQLHPIGSGIAVFQNPPAGTRLTAGDSCSVTFIQGHPVAHLKVPGLGSGAVAQQKPKELFPERLH